MKLGRIVATDKWISLLNRASFPVKGCVNGFAVNKYPDVLPDRRFFAYPGDVISPLESIKPSGDITDLCRKMVEHLKGGTLGEVSCEPDTSVLDKCDTCHYIGNYVWYKGVATVHGNKIPFEGHTCNDGTYPVDHLVEEACKNVCDFDGDIAEFEGDAYCPICGSSQIYPVESKNLKGGNVK